MLLIREATPSDGERIELIDRDTAAMLRRTYRATAAVGARGSIYGPSIVLVAVLDGIVVGGVTCSREATSLHLRRMGVDPHYQRRGVAKTLVAAASDRARSSGLDRLSLDTIRETGNVEIFLRLGFVIVTEGPTNLFENAQGSSVTNVRMERVI